MSIKTAPKTLLFILLVLCTFTSKAIEGRLMVSTSPNFFDRWYKCYTQLPLAHIPQTQVVYKRQVFYMLPVITGFSTQNGKPNIKYDIAITQNGKTVFSRKAVTGLNKLVNDTASVYLCETILNYEFGNTDADGSYTIKVTVHDNVANTSAEMESTITVARYKFVEHRFTNADSFFVWQNYYYEGIEPDREIDGLMFFSFPQMQTNAEKTLALLAYFEDLFKGKTYLLKELENIFATRNADERLTIIHVLHLAGYMPQSFQNKFTVDEKAYYADLKGYGLPIIPNEVVNNHFLLNMLWAKFFATGSYEYAKKIAETMELAKHKGALAAYNESEQTEAQKQAAFLETVYQKNIEDMLKRLPNHPLFNGYCLYMMDRGDVSELVKKELAAVVVR